MKHSSRLSKPLKVTGAAIALLACCHAGAAPTMTTFDAPASKKTWVSGISKAGIVGSYDDNTPRAVQHGYVRAPDGAIATFDPDGSINTNAAGINALGTVTGTYDDSSDYAHGFERAPGGAITTFDVPGAPDTFGNSINTKGAIAGEYYDSSYVQHGYVRAPDGTITTFDPPG
jgi:hypothetical protein